MSSRARILAAILLVTSSIAACKSPGSGARTTTIAVVPKGQTLPYWQTLRAGAEKAAQDAGVAMEWIAPAGPELSHQASILEDLVRRRVTAIVLAPSDPKALAADVERVGAAGIPVVIIDSPLDSDRKVSYVATDNYQGGALAARRMAESLGGQGEVAILGIAASFGPGVERATGFQDTMRKEFPGITLVGLQRSDPDPDKAQALAEDFLIRFSNLRGFFGANELASTAVLRALEKRGRTGKVTVIAFEVSPELLQAVRAGTITALLVENPYRMGYDGVKTAVTAASGKAVVDRIDAGTVVLTSDTLDTPEVKRILNPGTS
jgi:ribose transport system substrate-binding protein